MLESSLGKKLFFPLKEKVNNNNWRRWWWWMARTNKYASLNFNHIYDKKINSSPFPNHTTNNPTKSTISSNLYKDHGGRMLVLTRPTPKPITSISTPPASPSPQTPLTQPPTGDQPRSEPEADRISLRPLGRTGAASPISSPVHGQDSQREVGNIVASPRLHKFVPPHLRPGFVGKEERPGPGHRPQQQQQQQGYFGSPGFYGEDGRPKSGGHDRMRRGGESDLGFMNRPGSTGNRPTSR